MDCSFIVENDESWKRPAASTLTGWETVVFELMDETEETLASEIEAWLVAHYF